MNIISIAVASPPSKPLNVLADTPSKWKTTALMVKVRGFNWLQPPPFRDGNNNGRLLGTCSWQEEFKLNRNVRSEACWTLRAGLPVSRKLSKKSGTYERVVPCVGIKLDG